MSSDQQYLVVVNSTRLVAAPYQLQKSLLPQFVVMTDEIANTFSEATSLIPQLISEGKINLEAASKIELLERMFSAMTKDESIWNDNSLSKGPVWQSCRNQAVQILNSLEETAEPIDLMYLSWEQ